MRDADQTAGMPISDPIFGRHAWTRADLKVEDWQVVLPPEAVAEVRYMLDSLRKQPVPLLALRPESYAIPACAATMATVRDILSDGVKFVLVQGLPTAEMTDDEAKCIYWILASMVSRPVAQKLDGTMIYDVTDTGAKPLPGSGVRPDKSNVDLQFHNDNAYNATMPDVVALLCIRNAKSGGTSRVMSFTTAHNALLERAPEALPRLYAKFPFDRQKEHAQDEDPLFEAPIFENHDGALRARLGLHQIHNAYALRGTMDSETDTALSAVGQVFCDPTLQFEFDMQPGDMQFARNCEVGHSRTEFQDYDDPNNRRMLVRLWMRDFGDQGYVG